MTTLTEGSLLVPWNAAASDPARYGGTSGKRSSVEGERPYAHGFYRMLQGAQGSAYSKEMRGLLHVENLADARQLAAAMRAAEKLQRNSLPSSSDESLGYWAEVLGVVARIGETDASVRDKAAAKFRGQIGNDTANVDAVLRALLGSLFVRTRRQKGVDLDNPPLRTFWPGVNPGPTSFSLRDESIGPADDANPFDARVNANPEGAWYSDRARLLIELKRGLKPDDEVSRIMNVDARAILDSLLAAWADWQWCFEGGFVLGNNALGASATEEL